MDEACERVDFLLRRAVREHLESDVPVASFLSGGIDSSLVGGYANDEAKGSIQAYTIGFAETRFDESPFARDTAAKIGAPLRVEFFDEAKALGSLPDALLAYDEPFGDSSSLATYLLSRYVARDFKVALSGDGGDEVFAGYKKYAVVHLRRPFAAVPGMRDALGGMLGALGRVPIRHSGSPVWTKWLRRIRLAGTALNGADAHVYAQLSPWAPLARTKALMRRPASTSRFEEETRARFSRGVGTELQKSLAADLGSMLTNDMLVKVDRASMACSLEVRVPFLDHRVAEFGVGLPAMFTVGPGGEAFRGKLVLRALHERRFGPALARRQKQGFSIPVKKWLEGPFDSACQRLFDKSRLDRYGVLSSDELSNGRFRRWVSGDDSLIAWHAFALAAWCEATLGDGPDALRDLIEPRTGKTARAVPAVGPSLRIAGSSR
jgi:asparagine synthase (glutamine-hydrolysing)